MSARGAHEAARANARAMSFRLRLHIHVDPDHSLGPGKIALLEAIEAEGSISAAARGSPRLEGS
jgi:hypothetical protein